MKKVKDLKNLKTKKGVVLISLLAAMILVVSIVTASYSWFTPQIQTGKSINYTAENVIRSENCSFTTYLGTKNTSGENIGKINYDTEHTVTGVQKVDITGVIYFKTKIENASDYPTDVSLYISSMPASIVAVAYPSNSVRTVSSAQSDYYIVRNAYVSVLDHSIKNSGELTVEWFLKASQGTEVDLSGLYLTYN